jgi:selenocysteine lyase/cysteine desulfurase
MPGRSRFLRVRGARPRARPSGVVAHVTLRRVDGCAPRDAAARLSDESGIFASHGTFYAATAVAKLVPTSRDGVIRAGLGIYSTTDEVRRLVDAVAALR